MAALLLRTSASDGGGKEGQPQAATPAPPQARTVAMVLCALLHPQHLPAPGFLPVLACSLSLQAGAGEDGYMAASGISEVFISSSDPLAYPSAGDQAWSPGLHLLALLYA